MHNLHYSGSHSPRGPSAACDQHPQAPKPKEEAVIISQTMLPSDSLAETVQEYMTTVCKELEHRVVAVEHEVLLCITREDVPNLDVVDWPGLVSMNEDDSEDLAKATYDLAKSVIEQEQGYSMFLLVVDVTSSVNLSWAAELVRLKCVEKQTIGVFTKLDKYVPESKNTQEEVADFAKKLLDSSLSPTHSWLVRANRDPPESLLFAAATAITSNAYAEVDDYRFALMAGYEACLLQAEGELTQGFNIEMKQRAGLLAVRKRVQTLFEDFLLLTWVPQCLSTLQKEFQSLVEKHVSFGLPFPAPCGHEEAVRSQLASLSSAANGVIVTMKYSKRVFNPWHTCCRGRKGSCCL